MATAGERLVELRTRVRRYDDAVQAERIEVIGKAFTEGAVKLPLKTLQTVAESCQEKAAESHQKVAQSLNEAASAEKAGDAMVATERGKAAARYKKAAAEHEEDRKLVESENLELDGYRHEKREDGTVFWRGLRDWPGIPQRPPPTRLDDAQTGVGGGGGGGSSTGGPAPRPLTLQERLDAEAWEAYYQWMSDEDEWIKRQKRRAWLVGEFLLQTVLNDPKIRLVFRDSGVERAAELLSEGWPDSSSLNFVQEETLNDG